LAGLPFARYDNRFHADVFEVLIDFRLAVATVGGHLARRSPGALLGPLDGGRQLQPTPRPAGGPAQRPAGVAENPFRVDGAALCQARQLAGDAQHGGPWKNSAVYVISREQWQRHARDTDHG